MTRSITTLALGFTLLFGCTKDQGDTAAKDQAPPPGATTTVTPPAPPAAPAPPTSPVLGKPAPDFTLEAIDGSKVALAAFKGKTVVLEWFNPGCPFVQRSHTKGSLIDTAQRHLGEGVVWLAINSGEIGRAHV